MPKYEKDETNERTDGPPFTVDILADVVRRYSRTRKRWPADMPRDAQEAARWWVARQKPADESREAPRQVAVIGNRDAQRWATPYADRLSASLRAFFKISHSEQLFVLAAFQDEVFYNGDTPEMFHSIYAETMKMREVGFDAYRSESVKKLKALVAGIG